MHRVGSFAVFTIVILAGLMQAAGFEYINLLGIKPDLLLIIVVFFSLSCSIDAAIKSALAAGLIKDITSSLTLGSYTIAFLLLAIFLNYQQRRFFIERVSTQALITFAFYFGTAVLALSINFLSVKTAFPDYSFMEVIFKAAIYTGIISPVIFFILSRILRIRLAYSL